MLVFAELAPYNHGYHCECIALLQGVMSNGPAKKAGISETLQQAGETSGDPFEISTIRREVGYQ